MSVHPKLVPFSTINDEAKELALRMSQLHDKKLWHELTDVLESLVSTYSVTHGATLGPLFTSFVNPILPRLNPLRATLLAVRISRVLSSLGDTPSSSSFPSSSSSSSSSSSLFDGNGNGGGSVASGSVASGSGCGSARDFLMETVLVGVGAEVDAEAEALREAGRRRAVLARKEKAKRDAERGRAVSPEAKAEAERVEKEEEERVKAEAKAKEELEAKKVIKDAEALIVARCERGRLALAMGDVEQAKLAAECTQRELSGIPGAEFVAIAASHFLYAEYYRALGSPMEFYHHALQFLAYSDVSALAGGDLDVLAHELGIAALVGDGIFNFGELLNNEIVARLESAEPWLHGLLFAFNNGDVAKYKDISAKHAADIAAQPALVASADKLTEKMAIMTLLEITFKRPPHDRVISFNEISDATGVPIDKVEFLIMRALALKLIRGTIDEVDKVVRITWLLPRILGKDQIDGIITQLDRWTEKADEALKSLEEKEAAEEEAAAK